ncbi:calmodulin regulator protein PCP4a [Girardinichthys multiradiatus]|uniref:calmodulin regulator protein PCP4a n=1 Tax=Girardinichthys multiradiatus TaxID=208333 RepID=UPI001FAC511B|nr:calmodulin regulator protein PCP4a [Girardinichthys multiradiatus]
MTTSAPNPCFKTITGTNWRNKINPLPKSIFLLFHFLSTPDEQKNKLPLDFDIDMEDPETKKAAVAIQSQFRKFQKKKQDVKS